MTPIGLPARVTRITEALVFVAVVSSWGIAYAATDRLIGELPLGSRLRLLDMWATQERIWAAPLLGVAAAVSLVAQRFHATAGFVAVAASIVVAEFAYPLVTSVAFSGRILVAVAAFWALVRTCRFELVIACALSSAVAVTVPHYTVNQNLGIVSRSTTSNRFLVDLNSLMNTVEAVMIMVITILAAIAVRRLNAQTTELAERNEELKRERAALARAAVVDERVRIARDLHDVVAHHVTTMTVHAGAARMGEAPSPSSAVLQHIEEAGRNAMTELGRMLGFLRSDLDLSPVEGSLHNVDALVKNKPGFRGEISVVGDLDTVPRPVDVSAYRIVQEAVTNVLKHSTANEVEITIAVEPDRVRLTITDPGPARHSDSGARRRAPGDRTLDAGSGGHGLRGMRERAAAHGGRVDARPGDGGGWAVEAVLLFDPTEPSEVEPLAEKGRR